MATTDNIAVMGQGLLGSVLGAAPLVDPLVDPIDAESTDDGH